MPRKHILLVGGGHTHVGVIKALASNPIPNARVTLICDNIDTPYSGMLPGYVAGHYEFEQAHINLEKLAAYAGIEFERERATAIDREKKVVTCESGTQHAYDLLSINIGSTPHISAEISGSEHVTPVKPISSFHQRWSKLADNISRSTSKINLAVVGGGAGGVELILAIDYAFSKITGLEYELTLLCGSEKLLPTHNAKVQAKFYKVLKQRNIILETSTRVTKVQGKQVSCENGKQFTFDEIFWVTQAGGASWLKETGLGLDNRGFISVTPTLQSITDTSIFAAGDIATIEAAPTEKAGVVAVRQAKTIFNNLHAAVTGKTLQAYLPQKHWLALISTGDKHAVASKAWFYASGKWVWYWKDFIDRRFIVKFTKL